LPSSPAREIRRRFFEAIGVAALAVNSLDDREQMTALRLERATRRVEVVKDIPPDKLSNWKQQWGNAKSEL
jgi:hypothetical protein